MISPPNTVDTGCVLKRNDVTIPKFPPPPRGAQNRAAVSSALAVTISPSPVTTSQDSRCSQVKPYLRTSQPTPPPNVRPADAVRELPPPRSGRQLATL